MSVRIECQSEIRAVSVGSAMISKNKPHIGSVVVDMHFTRPRNEGERGGKEGRHYEVGIIADRRNPAHMR